VPNLPVKIGKREDVLRIYSKNPFAHTICDPHTLSILRWYWVL